MIRSSESRLRLGLMAVALAGLPVGCASVTNPVADGIPTRRLPEEIFPKLRDDLRTIPLSLLRQPPLVGGYKLDKGDVLGILIESVLGEKNQAPPVRLADLGGQPPALGYPIPVQEDGTITLPYVEPLNVKDKTLLDVQNMIREAYTRKRQILQPGTERIIVTLLQPRKYHVLVVRQDGGTGVNVENGLGNSKRGTGYSLDLPAGENDVLNALARTGGLPGLDAVNEVTIERSDVKLNPDGTMPPEAISRIPLRLRNGEPITFKPEDVVLRNGDIVFIETRDTEVFYTGGLLPPGEFALPRDYDLDIIEAIARVHGPLVNGGFNQNNQFSSQLLASGLGFPSPSLATVLRKTSYGRQLAIRVDLNKALRDPRERVIIQPSDIIILQEKPSEAFVRYFSTVFRYNFLGTIIRQRDLEATLNLNGP
jgi:protein involved in polysaccharide export with SLBB domain